MKSGTALPKSVTCATSGGMIRNPIPVTTKRAVTKTSTPTGARARRSIASTAGLSAAASSIAMMIHVSGRQAR